MSSLPPSPELIDAYLAGTLSSADAERVRAYLAGRAGRQGTIAGVRAAVTGEGAARRPSREASWRALTGKLDMAGEADTRPVMRRSTAPASLRASFFDRTLQSRVTYAVVGVASVVLGVSLWLRQSTTPYISSSVYRTRSAERLTVTLANGNRVMLAPHSTLTLQGSRATLAGEALFTIVHRDKTPLVVQAGPVSVRVLGTAFDVRHYSGDRAARIAVLAGKVEVRSNTDARSLALTMPAGQMAFVSDSSVVRTTDINDATRWTTGQLVFTEALVCDVLRTVGQWYGYRFTLSGRDSLAITQRHITAILDGQSVSDAMRVLGGLLNATATVDSAVTGPPVITLHVNASVRSGAADIPGRREFLDAFTTSRERGR